MKRFTAAEVQRKWGYVQDAAIAHPILVTCNGRERIVVLSIEEYLRLKEHDREVLSLDRFSAEDIQAIEAVRAPEESRLFDDELKIS